MLGLLAYGFLVLDSFQRLAGDSFTTSGVLAGIALLLVPASVLSVPEGSRKWPFVVVGFLVEAAVVFVLFAGFALAEINR